MGIAERMEALFRQSLSKWGSTLTYQGKSKAYNDADYDEATWSNSGVVETAQGIRQPLALGKSADENAYLVQGILKNGDFRLFIGSGTQITDETDVVIDGGSYYCLMYQNWMVAGSLIYRSAFIRPIVQHEASQHG